MKTRILKAMMALFIITTVVVMNAAAKQILVCYNPTGDVITYSIIRLPGQLGCEDVVWEDYVIECIDLEGIYIPGPNNQVDNDIRTFQIVSNETIMIFTEVIRGQLTFLGKTTSVPPFVVPHNDDIVVEILVAPNPFSHSARVILGPLTQFADQFQLVLSDIIDPQNPVIVLILNGADNQNMIIQRGNLPAGNYAYDILINDMVVRSGQLIISE